MFGGAKMGEKELVPAKSVHDDLLEAFRGAAHTNAERTARATEKSSESLDEIQKLLRKGRKKYVFIEHLFR